MILLAMKAPVPRKKEKLVPHFIGSYRILKVFPNKTVEIQEVSGKQTQLIHVYRLKPLCESMV